MEKSTPTFSHVENKTMVAVLNKQATNHGERENRKEIKEGDEVYGLWFNDGRWFKFTVQRKHKYQDEYKTGLGFIDGQAFSDIFSGDPTFHDIGQAFSIVKLQDIKPGVRMRYTGEDKSTIKKGEQKIVYSVGFTDKFEHFPSGIVMWMTSDGGGLFGQTDASEWEIIVNS